MARQVTIQDAHCGCRVFYEWDEAETAAWGHACQAGQPAERRLKAVDPATLVGLSTLPLSQLKRLACKAHAGADHHEHFHNLKRDEMADAVSDEGRHELRRDPDGAAREVFIPKGA